MNPPPGDPTLGAGPSDAASPRASGRLGKYALTEKLGEGGMGEVWKAWDGDLGRWAAVKFMKGSDPEELARFRREALTAAQLNHPNIAAVYEARERYLAMQYVEGQTLQTYPRNDVRRLVEILRQAASAVHFAHENGIVHRDLKPANIMVDGRITRPPTERFTTGAPRREEVPHAYVMDFGLAKSMTVGAALSMSGSVLGTPSYMSPEQAMGRVRDVDARSDVYSLGATLYELLSGRPPFQAPNVYDLLRVIVEEDPVPLRRLNPRIDRDLETVVMKCLEKRRVRRYASAAGLADDLGRWLAGEPVLARPPGRARRAWRFVRRHATASLAIGALLLGAAAAAAAVGWIRRPEPWRLVAEDDFERAAPEAAWENVIRPAIACHDGALCVRRGHVTFAGAFEPPVRISFEVTIQPDSQDPKEASFFLAGSEAGGLADGYSLEHGLNGKEDAIQRMRKEVAKRPGRPVTPGTRVVVEGEWDGRTVILRVDGIEVQRLEDPEPLKGTVVGIGSQCDHLHYDRFRVWRRVSEPVAEVQRLQSLVGTGRAAEACRLIEARVANPGLASDAADALMDIYIRAAGPRDLESAVRMAAAARRRFGRVANRSAQAANQVFLDQLEALDDAAALARIREIVARLGPEAGELLEYRRLTLVSVHPELDPEETRRALESRASASLALRVALQWWSEGRVAEAAELVAGASRQEGSFAPALLDGVLERSGAKLAEAARTGRRFFSDSAEESGLLAYAAALAVLDDPEAPDFKANLRALLAQPNLDSPGFVVRALAGAEEAEVRKRIPPTANLVLPRDATFVKAVAFLFHRDREGAREALHRYLAQRNPGQFRGLAKKILERLDRR